MKPWIETPLLESATLSKVAGCRIFLKLDNLQPCGSFKQRGIGNLILSHAQSAKIPPHFYSSSGGNAGLACVTAACALGHPSTVVVPMSTKPHMIELIRLAGASEVIQHGATWFEADTHLRKEVLPQHPEGVYVSPFNDPLVWDGAATMVDEIHAQLEARNRDTVLEHEAEPAVAAIVCSVGGGGLFCGIMQGIKDTPTRVIASETKGADSLDASIKAGELVTIPGITSIAHSLGATRVADQAFKYAQDDRAKNVVVTDEQAVKACIRFANDERMLVEPACGATLAVAYEGLLKELLPDLKEDSRVVLVVCGGKNISLDQLHAWQVQYGV